METNIIDGKAIAKEIKDNVAKDVEYVKSKGVTPCLAVILVGNNPASLSYITGKQNALAECGMTDRTIKLGENTTETYLLQLISDLNRDDTVHGILVQLPLPPQIDAHKITCAIAPTKDVDGFTPINVGNLVIGKKCFKPCTPAGIIEILKHENIPTNGANTVIVGRSGIVGKPLALMMMSREINSTVTICHTGTKNMPILTRNADILIVASGRPHTISRDMVREGATVIDVGINRIPDPVKKSGFRLVGDCDELIGTAGNVTPVPGGVGPLTIAMLMKNTIESAAYHNKIVIPKNDTPVQK